MMQGWLSGWKEISAYCGGVTKQTAKMYWKRYGLPIRRLPNGWPVAIPEELTQWLVEIDEIRRKKKKTPK